MTNDQFARLFNYMTKRFDRIEAVLEQKADKAELEKQTTLIDDLYKRMEVGEDERAVIGHQLTRVEGRIEGLDKRVGSLEGKVDSIEGRFEGLENRFDNLENRFDNLEDRFDGLEHRFDGLEGRFDGFENQFHDLTKDVRVLQTTMTRVEKQTHAIARHVGYLPAH